MGSCGTKIQKETKNLDNVFKPSCTPPQNNLMHDRLDLVISYYARNVNHLFYQSNSSDIINLCLIYYGKRSTKIFIGGYIFDFQSKTTSKLSLQTKTTFSSWFCYIPNIDRLLDIKTKMTTNSLDGILARKHLNPQPGDKYPQYPPVLLLFDPTSNQDQVTECIQIELIPNIKKYPYGALYCGDHGIFYCNYYENSWFKLSFSEDCEIDFDYQHKNIPMQIKLKSNKWKMFQGEGYHYYVICVCYLQNRSMIFSICRDQVPQNVHDKQVNLFDLEKKEHVYGGGRDSNFNVQCNGIDTRVDLSGYCYSYASCYDGIKYVYIVACDGYVVRFNVDDKSHETIFAADDDNELYMIQHRVWMEHEDLLYCTDGRYWMYMDVNHDRVWISFDVDLGFDIGQGKKRKNVFM